MKREADFPSFNSVRDRFADSIQDSVACTLQLSGADQYSDERAPGTDCRRAGQADRPRYYRLAHEHHLWYVGYEREGAWTRY